MQILANPEYSIKQKLKKIANFIRNSFLLPENTFILIKTKKLSVTSDGFSKFEKTYSKSEILEKDLIEAESFLNNSSFGAKQSVIITAYSDFFLKQGEIKNRSSVTINNQEFSFSVTNKPFLKEEIKLLETLSNMICTTIEAMDKISIAGVLTNINKDLVTCVNPDGILLFVNNASKKIWGFEPKECIGKSFLNFLFTEDREKIKKDFNSWIEKKLNSIEYENTQKNKKGTQYHLKWTINFRYDNNNELIDIWSTAKDITKIKNLISQAEDEKIKLNNILDSIDDIIYISDPDTFELVHVNQAFINTFGNPKKGKKCFKVLQNRDEPCPFCTNKEIFGKNLGKSFIWEFQNEVNQEWYKCTDKTIKWSDGRILRFESATIISGLKKLQIKLAKSNQDLQQFAFIASHDLQEPLRMISGYTQLIKNRYSHLIGEEGKEFIDFAVDGANRMKILITDLLKYSRVDSRGKAFKKVNLNTLIDNVIKYNGVAINKKNARVEKTNLPEIYCDESQMNQVFQNIILNAIKFNENTTPLVKINSCEKGNNFIITISDNGIGIPEKYRDQIFIIFKRLHGGAKYKGTGIGLAVCKKIIERHHGNITVLSNEEKGSTFKIILPNNIPTE